MGGEDSVGFPLVRPHQVVGRIVLSSILAVLIVGCASAPRKKSAEPVTIEAKGVAFLEEAGSPVASTQNEWDLLIEATGKGLAAPNAVSAIHKELTALEAAKYRALAELGEKMRGMRVTRTGKVRDMAFSSEEVAVELSSEIEGAHIVRETYDAETGIAEVTVRVGMDKSGNMISQSVPRLTPLSLPERMARAEEAARIRAAAALRTKIGEVRVEESVEVRDLVLLNHQARQHVDGMLENVAFSKAKWTSRTQCEVDAKVTLSKEDIKRLADWTPKKSP